MRKANLGDIFCDERSESQKTGVYDVRNRDDVNSNHISHRSISAQLLVHGQDAKLTMTIIIESYCFFYLDLRPYPFELRKDGDHARCYALQAPAFHATDVAELVKAPLVSEVRRLASGKLPLKVRDTGRGDLL